MRRFMRYEMQRKLKSLVRGSILTVVMALVIPFGVHAEEEGIDIESSFPDAIFRAFIEETVDNDKNGVLSEEEIRATTSIYLDYTNVEDLTGIKYFTILKRLDCMDTKVSVLDVSGCKSLEALNCSGCGLTELDVSGCTALTELYFDAYLLSKVNVRDCISLTELKCSYSDGLTELDVKGCTGLIDLECQGGAFTKLDVSDCTSLKTLNCFDNQLTELNVSGCESLVTLWCSSNKLTKLDLSDCVGLSKIWAYNNQLSKINIHNNMQLINYSKDGPYKDDADGRIGYGKDGDSYHIMIDAGVRLITVSSPCQNHTWDSGTITKKATCTTTGIKTLTCTICGETTTETIKVTAHKEVKDPAVAATFTRKGKTAGSHCATCGAIIKKQTVIPMKTGLNKVSGKTYYYKNGKKQSGWQSIGKKKYYFDKKTKVMATGKVKIGKKYYFFDKKTGVMKTGKIKIGKKCYYFSPAKKTLGQMKTGWVKIGKKYFYFSPKKKTLGQMVTGKLKIGKKVYKFNAKGVCLNK